ncbi:MAG: SDR family oxidoreductase [Rhodobacteraceae bacterium]|nr:SDR family oxidoreductase [Paracoccaceae bacterium]
MNRSSHVILFAIVAALTAWGAAVAEAATVLITGTNRGIGLELVRQYAERGWTVIGTARNPDTAIELNALAAQHKNITVEKLDLFDHAAIEALAGKYKDTPIDVLINNAGMLGDVPKQTVGSLDYDNFRDVLDVNAWGALKMAESFKPSLLKGEQKKVFAMTSGLGSSELTTRRGGFYAYRMSKAALNIGFRALAADWRADGIIVGIIAPGMVETDLLAASGYRGPASITTKVSVQGVMKVIDGMTLETNDKALNYDGRPIPW